MAGDLSSDPGPGSGAPGDRAPDDRALNGDRPEGRQPRLADFFWLGTAAATSVIGAGAIGFGLDNWLGTARWLTFAGLAFGVVAAVLMTVNQVRRFL